MGFFEWPILASPHPMAPKIEICNLTYWQCILNHVGYSGTDHEPHDLPACCKSHVLSHTQPCALFCAFGCGWMWSDTILWSQDDKELLGIYSAYAAHT